MKKRLLLIAMTPSPVQEAYVRTFSRWGWLVVPARTPEEAADAVTRQPEACILDLSWPTPVLTRLIETVRSTSSGAPIMLRGHWIRPDLHELIEQYDIMLSTTYEESLPTDIHFRLKAKAPKPRTRRADARKPRSEMVRAQCNVP